MAGDGGPADGQRVGKLPWIAPGETTKVFVKVNPGRAFPIKVTEFVPGQRMVWRSMPDLGPSFTQFANGLKRRAESGR